jgi:phosphatidylglycerophosphate synthase
MRSADAATLFRTLMVFLIAYLVIIKFGPLITILLILVMYVLDGVDGYFAIRSASKSSVGFIEYIKASIGKDEEAKEKMSKFKHIAKKDSKFGPRIDIAGDRVIEYTFWILFTYLRLIPLFVVFIIIFRHSFVDALMASRGTSSKPKTKFARIVYSSNIGRGGINVVKFLAFAYFVLVYVSSYPLWIGYILIAILVIYIVLRGIAEAYDVLS